MQRVSEQCKCLIGAGDHVRLFCKGRISNIWSILFYFPFCIDFQFSSHLPAENVTFLEKKLNDAANSESCTIIFCMKYIVRAFFEQLLTHPTKQISYILLNYHTVKSWHNILQIPFGNIDYIIFFMEKDIFSLSWLSLRASCYFRHFSVPFLPDIPGQETFSGEITHSQFHRLPQKYDDKTVLVLGAGESGVDIAADLSPHATRINRK